MTMLISFLLLFSATISVSRQIPIDSTVFYNQDNNSKASYYKYKSYEYGSGLDKCITNQNYFDLLVEANNAIKHLIISQNISNYFTVGMDLPKSKLTAIGYVDFVKTWTIEDKAIAARILGDFYYVTTKPDKMDNPTELYTVYNIINGKLLTSFTNPIPIIICNKNLLVYDMYGYNFPAKRQFKNAMGIIHYLSPDSIIASIIVVKKIGSSNFPDWLNYYPAYVSGRFTISNPTSIHGVDSDTTSEVSIMFTNNSINNDGVQFELPVKAKSISIDAFENDKIQLIKYLNP